MVTRRNLGLAAVLMGMVLMLGLSTRAPAQEKKDDVNGTWKWTVEGFGGPQDVVLKLKQDGEKVTGTISGFQGEDQAIEDGKVKEGQVTFKVTRDFGGREMVTMYTAKITGDAIKGKSEVIIAQPIDGKRSK